MAINALTLRDNITRLLDQVLDSGQPLEIERKGKLLRVVPVLGPSKIDRLVQHDCLRGDPEALVHLDWSREWRHDLP